MFQTEVLESMETAPIVVDGVMYLTTSYNHVYAIDAVDRQGVLALQAQDGAGHHLSAAARTTAAWPSWATGSTWARSTPSWSRSTPRPARCCGQRRSPIPELGYSETMAPVAVDGKVLIGTNGGEYGIRGFVKAFDANDGKLLWTFYTIPEKGHEGVWATQRRDRPQHAARHRRGEGAARDKGGDFYKTLGGGVWMAPAVDQETNTVFFVVGNPEPRPVRRRAPGRQPLHQLDGRGRPRHRRVQVALPVHRARRVGPGRGHRR